MNVSEITNYLGVEPDTEGIINPQETIIFNYNSPKLKYQIYINKEEKEFSISADFTQPFSSTSLFEFTVWWDCITIEKETKFYGDWEFLMCRQDGHKTLMLRKTESGELSVWPSLKE